MTQSDQIVTDLHTMLEREGNDLTRMVEQSLKQASDRAHQDLDPKILAALDWPTDLEGYDAYLRSFIAWVPQQSDDAAWKDTAPEERYAKEVSIRLAHFFWLVDQQVGDDKSSTLQNNDAFGDWLTQFARQWGSFLDSPQSFNQDILESFIKNAPEYTIGESLVNGHPNAPSGWLTFNQFFARELNPGLRPITSPGDNHVVTSPADCLFKHIYDIDDESNIPATTIKQTHTYGNIKDLLKGSEYADAFAGGTFVHYMLPPSSYHRFHTPVAGTVKESFVISGTVYMEVDLADHELQSMDSTETGYEFTQVHGALTLDTTDSECGDVGIVAVVPVGMSHVASVTMTAGKDTTLTKGAEFGYFQFGGSDIIVLFQAGRNPQIDTDKALRHVGSVIARIE
ncbi:MAG: phosphatidylserine decarboxylase [Actinomycetota bacterium]|nr:phosphatidylserine decarboxylase [Actinomycetota bacterium]